MNEWCGLLGVSYVRISNEDFELLMCRSEHDDDRDVM